MKYMKLFVIAVLFFAGCEQSGNQTDAATDDPLPDGVPDGVSYGILSVTSLPEGANVFLDGEVKGMTNTSIEDLAAGDYQLMVSLDGYYDHQQVVTVVADNVTDVEVTLQPEVIYNLAGRWSMDGEPDICDVRQNGNEVRGFCRAPEPWQLTASSLLYSEDAQGYYGDGEVQNEGNRIHLHYYSPNDEKFFDYYYTRL